MVFFPKTLLIFLVCQQLLATFVVRFQRLQNTKKYFIMANQKIVELLGDKASFFLDHQCKTIDKNSIHLPAPSHVDDTWINSNRNNQTLRSLQDLLSHGRLGGTGYCSIFPVD